MTDPQVGQPLAPPNLWDWEAGYNDGTSLRERPEEGGQHFWRDIDQERLVTFTLHPQAPHLPGFALEVRDQERLIFLRRVSQRLEPEPVQDAEGLLYRVAGARYTWHVLGLQTTLEGRNHAVYLFIAEEGFAFLSTDPQANERVALGESVEGVEEELADALPE